MVATDQSDGWNLSYGGTSPLDNGNKLFLSIASYTILTNPPGVISACINIYDTGCTLQQGWNFISIRKSNGSRSNVSYGNNYIVSHTNDWIASVNGNSGATNNAMMWAGYRYGTTDDLTRNFYFGNSKPGAASDYYFTGKICEAAIYSRAITDAEVSNLYNSGAGRTYSVTGGTIAVGISKRVTIGSITLTANSVLNNPIGTIVDYALLQVVVRQDTTGGRTLSLDTNYRYGSTPQIDTTANNTTYLFFQFNPTDAKWDWLPMGSGSGSGKQMYWLPDFVRPVLANFNWVNQGTATANNNGGIINIYAPPIGGDNCRMLVKSKTFPATIEAFFIPFLQNAANNQCGIIIRDSTSQKFVSFRVYQAAVGASYADVVRFNSPTAFAPNGEVVASNCIYGASMIGIKIVISATLIDYYLAFDCLNYTLFKEESRTAFTPALDQIGFYASSYNATWPASISLVHWKES